MSPTDARLALIQDWVATGLVALAYVTLLVGNVVHVQRYGHFYKGGFTFTSFADTLTFLLRQTSVDTAWPAALLGGAAMLAIVVRRSRREGADAVSRERRQIRASLLLLAGAFAVLVVPQCVIYGTTPVHYPRYLIPGNFFALLVIAWSGWVLQREPDRRWRGLASVIVLGIVVAATLATARGSRTFAAHFAVATRQLHGTLAQVHRLAEQYPAIEPWIEKGIAVSIDGVIYRDTWGKALPEGAEIFLLPRLAGG